MHSRYTQLLVGLMISLTFGFGLWARGLEPLWGDLTRMGWRSENDFGWTVPKERFQPLAAEVGALDRHYDVVAIGDSFTGESRWRPGTSWPHYLAHDTGLKVGIFDRDFDLLGRLLASPGFAADPPSVVIYEVVERHLAQSNPWPADTACPTAAEPPHVTLTQGLPSAPPIEDRRRTERYWNELPVSYGLAYLERNALRALIGHETTEAVELDLARGGLFSSRQDRKLLVYGEDFNKLGWTEAQWRGAACSLLSLQARVEANGRTLFLAMVAPDKLTAYGPYLADAPFRGISRLDLVAVPGLNLVRFDQGFEPTEHIDLYLPDDTHWSTVGHALAAKLVERKLRALGALPPLAASLSAPADDPNTDPDRSAPPENR
ncbi:MAG TPA: hypothetical protein VM689_19425 [Aliidongia sp.]|nr:hypothetical protein [Aliidongia sp.]